LKTKEMRNMEFTKKPGVTQVLAKGKQFLIHISHSPCYSYGQVR